MHEKHHFYNLYDKSCDLIFYYVMYYKVSEIGTNGRFLEDYFYNFSQQIISLVAKEPLTTYNHVEKSREAQSTARQISTKNAQLRPDLLVAIPS